MNKCPNCGKTISEYATTCPHCKAEIKPGLSNVESTKIFARKYSGSAVSEIINFIIPSIIMLLIMTIQETVNKSVLGNIGTNAVDAYELCQNNMGIFKRFIILLVVFIICGIVTNVILKNFGDKKVIRIIIGIVGIVVYTSILVSMCVAPNVGGREDLIGYVRVLIRTMGMFCGLSYSFAVVSMNYFLVQKNYVMVIVEALLIVVLFGVGSFLCVNVLMLGMNGIYNMITVVAVMVVAIVPIFIIPKKSHKITVDK